MKENKITYRVSARYALFTDPMSKLGGEKSTLMVPTAEALIGVTSSIYWKPSIKWIIDEVTILEPIRTESKGIRPIKYDGGNDLAYYTYLREVSYLVTAHFEFNTLREDLKADFNEDKHYQIAKRSLARGGRRDVFLGTRECQAYVEEVTGQEESCYKDMPDMEFGLMFHSFVYPDQSGKSELDALFWYPKMKHGVITYCLQEDCPRRVFVKKMEPKAFSKNNYTFLNEKDFQESEGGIW